MKRISAKKSQADLPLWATLERRLIDVIDDSTDIVMEKYVRPDGSIMWPPVEEGFESIDALDDAYESFHNWPLYYMLGGAEKFLKLSHFEYDAITKQFARLSSGHGHPMVVDEYEQGYDWMHQSEGYLFFYLLNLADPENEKNRERSIRYAALYTGENKNVDNYDAEKKMMRCCYLGSMGAASRNFDDRPWSYIDWMSYYGLPYMDVEGCVTVEDLKIPEKAKRMGEVMRERLSHSDTFINIFTTTMAMNAYLHTGEKKYVDWIDEYAGAWRERVAENGGIAPDNVGPDGKIGGAMNGKWYGGYYGWTWPHGFYLIADAMAVTGQTQCLLHKDPSKVDWLRVQVEKLIEVSLDRDGTILIPQKHAEPGARQEYYNGKRFPVMPGVEKITDREDFEVLFEKDGWYEFYPMRISPLAHAYMLTLEGREMGLIRKLYNKQSPEENCVHADRYTKDQGGHEVPWLEYLHGNYPTYPEEILTHAIKLVYGRLKFMREDTQDPMTYSDAYLQMRNPVNVEALVQLTTGGLPPVYHGGLWMTSLRHYDAQNKRPGLPKDVAALVSEVLKGALTVTLVNTSPTQPRSLIMEAGAFGEHEFMEAEITELAGDPEVVHIGGKWLAVDLAPASVVTLKLKMKRFVNEPRYQLPWEEC